MRRLCGIQMIATMPFGKHKGERLGDVPDSYFNWFLSQDWCDEWPSLVDYANVIELRSDS